MVGASRTSLGKLRRRALLKVVVKCPGAEGVIMVDIKVVTWVGGIR